LDILLDAGLEGIIDSIGIGEGRGDFDIPSEGRVLVME